MDEALSGRYRRFPARPARADSRPLDIEITFDHADTALPGLSANGDIPEYPLEIARAGFRLALKSWYFDGWVDLDRRRGAASVATRDSAGSVENFLRVAIAHLLLPEGGFLLHAAAVVCDGGAVICFGPSGAGKSTIASLAGSRPVISDDLIACRRRDDGALVVVPTPFRAGGAAPCHDGHEVRAFYRLSQGGAHSVEAIEPRRAALEIIGSMPFVHDEPLASGEALRIAAETATDPGIERLVFAPDASVWPFIEGRLR